MNQDSSERRGIPTGHYLWDYFQLHASQRLTTFNFYIGISAVITTAYTLAVTELTTSPVGIVLGAVLFIISCVFWKLDKRNRLLIKVAEDALKYLERRSNSQDDSEMAHALNIFTQEEAETSKLKRQKSVLFWKNHLSYSDCFNVVFALFGMLGVLGMVSAGITLASVTG